VQLVLAFMERVMASEGTIVKVEFLKKEIL
jgi:hypothetical protein